MTPRMSNDELTLFKSIVRCADSYIEFGAGGSTYVAASLVKGSITSIDSSAEWLAKVREACELEADFLKPTLVHADIGPTTDWGEPTDSSMRDRWASYHRDVWAKPRSSEADVYMIDGRFRVACFMQVLLHGRESSLIMFHDYRFREWYHAVAEVGQEIAVVESLSLFKRRRGVDDGRVREILAAYELNPA
jgi:hypothetical protein